MGITRKGSGIQSRKKKNISSIKEDNSDIYHSFGYIVSIRMKQMEERNEVKEDPQARNRCELMKKY